MFGISSVWIKIVAALLFIGAILGCLYAVHDAGVQQGIATGDKAGYTRAWNAQQPVIDKLTKTINDNATASNTKISELEQQAADNQATINALTKKQATQAQTILDQYKKANPQTALKCGMSIPTVNAIRDILELQ